MTPEEIRRAAIEIVERSTLRQGVPLRLEDEVALDQLAAAVAETMLTPGGGADGS